ncbi:MAG: TIGR00269 family protein, partial [Candidatus Diapherotrites archaeon]
NIYYGIKTGLNEAFIITTEKRSEILANCKDEAERLRTEAIIKPILRGRDIKRYYYEWAGLWVIVIPAGWTNQNRNNIDAEQFIYEQYPSLMNHLKIFEEKAKKRDDKGDYWWELRKCAYYPEFEKEKVVWAETIKIYFNDTRNYPRFSYTNNEFYLDKTTFFMSGNNQKYLLGVLNSKVVEYLLENGYSAKLGSGSRGLQKIFIERIPIPCLSSDNIDKANQIEAIMVDEGIKGYRDKAIEVAINFCETHNIKYHVLSFKRELGVETKQIMEKILFDKKLGSTCAFCGVLRRKLLNEKAKEIGAHKIATGHNLDDECQSIVMNFFDNDLVGLLRTTERMEKKYYDLVPRIKPLYETPEKEVIAYTAICGIEHYSNECCPYSWTSKRSYYRKMLNELEEQFPGTKYKILEMHSRLKRKVILGIQKEIGKCVVCNNPTASKDVLKCSACKQLEKINNVKEGKKRVKENLNLSCTAKYNL